MLFRKDGYVRKKIYHGCFGVNRKQLYSVSFVVPNSYPPNRFFYPDRLAMNDSYILGFVVSDL